uniref:DUF6598 domain-containing protein n=1 Tax=Oryza barthii TaxID=65489 RepID=A0A0D3GW38_9ORYZ
MGKVNCNEKHTYGEEKEKEKVVETGCTSVNIISIKVIKSDVGYPISVFGTVLARDQYDYRCVYLFRRGRDDPQIINSPVSISYYLTNGD